MYPHKLVEQRKPKSFGNKNKFSIAQKRKNIKPIKMIIILIIFLNLFIYSSSNQQKEMIENIFFLLPRIAPN